VTVRSKAWVCGRSVAGIVGLNLGGGMEPCLLCLLCVVRYRSLYRADQSSTGVLQSVVCLNVVVKPRYEEALAQWGLLRHGNKHMLRWRIICCFNEGVSCLIKHNIHD